MAVSRKTLRNLVAFTRRQSQSREYHFPMLTDHELALKMNERFDIERAQERRRKENAHLRNS